MLKKLLILSVAVAFIASCGGIKSPLTSDDVAKLNASFNFEDQNLEKDVYKGPVTIELSKEVLAKLTNTSNKIDGIEVYVAKDPADDNLNDNYLVNTVKPSELVVGLNNLGTLSSLAEKPFKFSDGDKLILTISSSSEKKDKGNPLNTSIVTKIVDAVGVAASESKVVAITSPTVQTTEVASPANITLSTVYFDYDKSDLKPEFMNKLQTEIKQYLANANIKLLVTGHSDERGTVEYNLALGERRAAAVASYLTSLGIKSSNIQTVSYGEERPAVVGNDESAWSKNRRSEVMVLLSK